jgi:hypothetical protein
MNSNGTGLELESSIFIARPAEDIWKSLWEISNDTQRRTGTISAGWTSDPPYGVGSTGLHVVKGMGDFPWKATEVEEPRVMSWDTIGGRF